MASARMAAEVPDGQVVLERWRSRARAERLWSDEALLAELGLNVPALLVNVDVDDLDEAVRFYEGALGLRVGRRLGPGYVELLGAEVPVFLLAAPRGTPPFPGAAVARDYGRHWTPVHLDFTVDDIGAAVERAVAAGAKVEIAIAQHAYGKLAVLSDPFGHGFCLLQLEGRGYDEIAT